MTEKMSKLLKLFGTGGRSKNPPHPPKPDYGTQKSTSVQELLPKSPPRDRSSMSLSAAGAPGGDFDNASLTDSPHHNPVNLQTESERDLRGVGGHGGARPKEGAAARNLSPKSAGERIISAGSEDADGDGDTSVSTVPPRVLDEYSDPFDLKKQMAENAELLGALAPAPVADDDYSVPYEVKKLIQELKLREGGESRGSPRKGTQMNEDICNEDGAEVPVTTGQYSTEVQDVRPREDYDEPWEWSAKQTMFLQQMESMANQNSSVPVMTPKRNVLGNHPDSTDTTLEGEREENGEPSRDYTKPVREGEEEDYEGYTALQEDESGVSNTDDIVSPSLNTPCASHTSPSNVPNTHPSDRRMGNYEEPWDLSATQKDLEDKIKAVSASIDPDVELVDTLNLPEESQSLVIGFSVKNGSCPCPNKDMRPQEGYEKPWDWKPDRKDNRGPEGYEKPWDWKPHKKDDRPPDEYEEPWDNKTQEIEKDIIHARRAQDSANEDRTADDTRPAEDYDEPWDQKAKNRAVLARAGSEGSTRDVINTMSTPVTALGQQQQSPKKKSKLNLELGSGSPWNAVGERIDPKLPLEEQGWYHGSISRYDAENRLRVHKEGSYLVRMSESNKLDFSLSLRSARGFMHMKIVNRDGKFILGQFSQPFDGIPRMIHHYSISKLPIRGAEHMSLLHPVTHELL